MSASQGAAACDASDVRLPLRISLADLRRDEEWGVRMANGMGRIATPWRLWWRRFRYTTLPLLGLLGFTAVTFLLWTRQTEMPHAIGEVEAIRADVTAAEWDPDASCPIPKVGGPSTKRSKGQVVAQLDDRPLQGEMATLVQELNRRKKELDAMAARWRSAKPIAD